MEVLPTDAGIAASQAYEVSYFARKHGLTAAEARAGAGQSRKGKPTRREKEALSRAENRRQVRFTKEAESHISAEPGTRLSLLISRLPLRRPR